MNRRSLAWTVVLCAMVMTPAAQADVIDDWNNVWLETIRVTGGPPAPIAQAGAKLHAAMFDAINNVDPKYTAAVVQLSATKDTSKQAAAATAAHAVLTHLYAEPALQAMFDTALASSLAGIADGPSKSKGIQLGQNVAQAVIDSRAGDGSDIMMVYTPGVNPGDWRPTYPDFTDPFNPDWPSVKPWTMISGDMFRPAGPPVLNSQAYTDAFNQVKELGNLNSATRTADQTLLARFWANDRNGTYKPPGHLNEITQVIANQYNLSLLEKARLFALLNIAMADAGVLAWDSKYAMDIDFWRPITGIREADTDGNPDTIADTGWEPLSNDPMVNGFTPPFPAYASGHATFAGTHAAVLADFFGTDEISFIITSDDTFGVYRSFDRLSDAAWENAISRIYLGVHWIFDAEDGMNSGAQLGHYVAAHFMQPIDWSAIPEPGTGFMLGAGLIGLMRRRGRRARA